MSYSRAPGRNCSPWPGNSPRLVTLFDGASCKTKYARIPEGVRANTLHSKKFQFVFLKLKARLILKLTLRLEIFKIHVCLFVLFFLLLNIWHSNTIPKTIYFRTATEIIISMVTHLKCFAAFEAEGTTSESG